MPSFTDQPISPSEQEFSSEIPMESSTTDITTIPTFQETTSESTEMPTDQTSTEPNDGYEIETTAPTVQESNSPNPEEKQVRIDLDTTETTQTRTSTVENESSTHTYDIVTFGINEDGSIFYNDEKMANPDDQNSGIAEFIAEVEQNSDKAGSIEHIF